MNSTPPQSGPLRHEPAQSEPLPVSSLRPGKIQIIRGVETANSGGGQWPVYKFKLVLQEDGTLKGE